MATSWTAIASVTVGSGGAASISFTGIPSTYTDLVLKWSTRASNDPYSSQQNWEELSVNAQGAGTNITKIMVRGNGSAATSSGGEGVGYAPTSSATANCFSNTELYISGYASSKNKPMSLETVVESNTQTVFMDFQTLLWSQTAAITSLTLSPRSGTSANYVQYSTATLFGITNS